MDFFGESNKYNKMFQLLLWSSAQQIKLNSSKSINAQLVITLQNSGVIIKLYINKHDNAEFHKVLLKTNVQQSLE